MKCSIILPSYIPDKEVQAKAKVFFKSLIASVPSDGAQVVLVDNGSSAWGYQLDIALDEWFTLSRIQDVYVVIQKPKPIGYARAANIGLAMADGDYLFVLSNDLILPKGWMQRMIEEYERLGPGVLSPFHVIGTGDPFLGDTVGTGVYPTTEDSWYALWMTDRKTFQKVGYFDETMPYRFMDQDYSIRMKQAGFKVLRTGAVLVGHPEEASTHKKMGIDESPEMARMMQKHGVTLFREWLQKQAK